MLNIGGGELIIILLVALVVLGPERLPQVARQVGQTVNSLRGLARGFQSEIEAAAKPTPLTAPTSTHKAADEALTDDIAAASREQSTSIPAPPAPFAASVSEQLSDEAREQSAQMPLEVPDVTPGAPDDIEPSEEEAMTDPIGDEEE